MTLFIYIWTDILENYDDAIITGITPTIIAGNIFLNYRLVHYSSNVSRVAYWYHNLSFNITVVDTSEDYDDVITAGQDADG